MERRWVKLEEINPIDAQHSELIDEYHQENADYIKQLILNGSQILPIALDVNLNVVDGHARYYAYRELNTGSIEAFIGELPEAFQHGMFMVEHDNYLHFPEIMMHTEGANNMNVGVTIWWRKHIFKLPSGCQQVEYK